MQINLHFNDNNMTKKLRDLANRQIAFGLSRGLNLFVRQARDYPLNSYYGRVFEKRNKQFFKLTHSIANSDKRQWRYGHLTAAIQRQGDTPPAGARKQKSGRLADTSFMTKHVTGGKRYPRGSKKFVPFETAPIARRKGGAKAGSVVSKDSPKILYPREGSRTFFAKSKGKTILFKRLGRGQDARVQPMYHLQPFVTNKPKYDPKPVLRRWGGLRLDYFLRREIVKAMKTAKLK